MANSWGDINWGDGFYGLQNKEILIQEKIMDGDNLLGDLMSGEI
jgi:hypothetical protein